MKKPRPSAEPGFLMPFARHVPRGTSEDCHESVALLLLNLHHPRLYSRIMVPWRTFTPRKRSSLAPTSFIDPAQPVKADKAPSGRLWIHEIKHDGYRLQITSAAIACGFTP